MSEEREKDLDSRVKTLELEFKGLGEKVEIYQKASQQVVNLAFSLIIAATVAVIVKTLFY